jgi:hypothetical protein
LRVPRLILEGRRLPPKARPERRNSRFEWRGGTRENTLVATLQSNRL